MGDARWAMFRARHGGNTAVSSTARHRRGRYSHAVAAPPYTSAVPSQRIFIVRARRPPSSIAAAADPPPPPPIPLLRKLTVARVRQSQSSSRPINLRGNKLPTIVAYHSTRIRSFLGHRLGSTAYTRAGRRARLSEISQTVTTYQVPRGRHHGQAQHGHERLWVRMGVRQGKGWPDDMAEDHHGHIRPKLARVSRSVGQELGWIWPHYINIYYYNNIPMMILYA